MTTFEITIDNRKNAQLLARILKSMAFVKNIEEELPVSPNSNQFLILQNFFNSIEPNSMFRDINNPVEWKKIYAMNGKLVDTNIFLRFYNGLCG